MSLSPNKETTMNTCRVCKEQVFDGSLFKYGVRHYAHGRCGLEKFGEKFLDMIPEHELGRLPYMALEETGLLETVEIRVAAIRAVQEDVRRTRAIV